MKLESNYASQEAYHVPALLKSAVDYLNIKPGRLYVDATIGGGSHSLEILKKKGKVFGLDCDSDAVKHSQKRLAAFCANLPAGGACPLNAFEVVSGNFVHLGEILDKRQIVHPAGILFDLGTSQYQLMSKGRGFSFNTDEPLDMRMDKNLQVKAADLIGGLGQKELYELFNRLGEEKYSRAIAAAVVNARKLSPIKTTGQLAEIAEKVYFKHKVKLKIHPATKIFQALRIAVNDELNNLREALPQALKKLMPGGRIVVISFHGLEDKIVKIFFKEKQKQGQLKIITKKPICPQVREKMSNPACRSAKLRTAEKI